MRQDAKRRARNRWRKNQIKDAVKKFDALIEDGNTSEAEQQLKVCFSTLDKVAGKGTIHKNAASRKKARLSKKLDKAKA
jgi:small subunit ribosomal protein S20